MDNMHLLGIAQASMGEIAAVPRGEGGRKIKHFLIVRAYRTWNSEHMLLMVHRCAVQKQHA